MKRLAIVLALLAAFALGWAARATAIAPSAPQSYTFVPVPRPAAPVLGDVIPVPLPSRAYGEPDPEQPTPAPVTPSGGADRPDTSAPVPHPAVSGAGAEATRIGTATWYCSSRSTCTRGHGPSEMIAAAGSELRIGAWRGRVVTVVSGSRSVRVRLVDACWCKGSRIIDLSRAAFARLADPSHGLVRVTVRW